MTTPAQYELYRVILDYEALQDGFADRIEELNVTLTEIDMAAGMTRGQTQKLLRKLGADDFRPSAQRKYSRGFAWETLGKTLKGTGLALALIIDDERFAAKKAEMSKRLRPNRSIVRTRRPKWLFTTEKARKISKKRWESIPKELRPAMMKKAMRAAKARWKAKRQGEAHKAANARAIPAPAIQPATT